MTFLDSSTPVSRTERPGGPVAAVVVIWAPVFFPNNGVDALAGMTRLHMRPLWAPACGVARVYSNTLIRQTGALGY